MQGRKCYGTLQRFQGCLKKKSYRKKKKNAFFVGAKNDLYPPSPQSHFEQQK
jgi:hypothetical protein